MTTIMLSGHKDYRVRLPPLKRPQGWGVLDHHATRTRAAQEYLAFVSPFDRTADAERLGFEEANKGCVDGGQPAKNEGVLHLDVDQCDSGVRAPAGPPPPAVQAGHSQVLGWGALITGVVMAPWFIWAPIFGAIVFGVAIVKQERLNALRSDQLYQDGDSRFLVFPQSSTLSRPHTYRNQRHTLALTLALLTLVAVVFGMLMITLLATRQDPVRHVGAEINDAPSRAELRARVEATSSSRSGASKRPQSVVSADTEGRADKEQAISE